VSGGERLHLKAALERRLSSHPFPSIASVVRRCLFRLFVRCLLRPLLFGWFGQRGGCANYWQ
jgi:hypothetical protein